MTPLLAALAAPRATPSYQVLVRQLKTHKFLVDYTYASAVGSVSVSPRFHLVKLEHQWGGSAAEEVVSVRPP